MNDWNWAVIQLQDGKKVRRNDWFLHPRGYWVVKNGRIVTNEGLPPSININFIGNKWELYQEKLWLSDLKPGDKFKLQDPYWSIFTFLETSQRAEDSLGYCYVKDNYLYHSDLDLEVEKVND